MESPGNSLPLRYYKLDAIKDIHSFLACARKSNLAPISTIRKIWRMTRPAAGKNYCVRTVLRPNAIISPARGRAQQPLPIADPPVASPPQLQPSPAPAPAAAQPPGPMKKAPASGQRQMFTVELRPGETTIVSWKKLIMESGNGDVSVPVISNLAPEARPVSGVRPGEDNLKDTLQTPNCFSAVIEKIERLYTGEESSDEEELDELPDDDQYDTGDSFIDDTELDEYFQVDKWLPNTMVILSTGESWNGSTHFTPC